MRLDFYILRNYLISVFVELLHIFAITPSFLDFNSIGPIACIKLLSHLKIQLSLPHVNKSSSVVCIFIVHSFLGDL